MPSLDFIRDIGDTLKSQGIDYVIVAIQRRKKDNRVDFFHHLSDMESLEVLEKSLITLQDDIKEMKKKKDNDGNK